jgi:hypothetical protein
MRWKKGRRLKLVREAEASPGIRAIFAEVRHALGVPEVPMLYQAYAALPKFLELHWQAFRPAIQSRQFFRMGERLNAEAYTRAQSYFDIPDLTSGDPHQAVNGDFLQHGYLSRTLEYYQYLDPLLLLITVAQMQAFDGTVGCLRDDSEAGNPVSFTTAPELAPLDGANSILFRIWEERRQMLDVAFVSDEHRALAMWPELYRRYWTALKNLVVSPLYADCQFRIGESAWQLVEDLPVQVETEIPRLLEAGITDEEVCHLARINESLITALTGLLLDITFLRIACEGGNRPERHPEKPIGSLEAEGAGTRAA